MRKAVILYLFLFILFISSADAARKISITSDKNSLASDEVMMVNASASGFTNGEKIFLKGVFYKEGGSNYFGFTNYNNSWIKNSENSKSQKEAIIGDWDNLIKVKLDYEDSGYEGIGNYKFKLGYYYLTSSGNISSVNWSTNILDISILKEPSPIPEPERVSVGLENSSNTEIVKSPTPKQDQVSVITPRKNIVKSAKITVDKKEASQYANIKPIENTEKKAEEMQVLGTKHEYFPKLYLFSGGIFLTVALIIIFKNELKDTNFIMKFVTNNYNETKNLGYEFSKKLKSGEVLLLYGELGAGKTSFTKGLAEGLGIKDRILSPTFVLQRIHEVSGKEIKKLNHIDLYRIEEPMEIEKLGLSEILGDENALSVIEWADRLKNCPLKKGYKLYFKYLGENKRQITSEKL